MNAHETSGLVSVIVPAFNAAATIESCLLSIVHQTYPAIEVLIVDDGSTDETMDKCARFVRPVEVVLHRLPRRAGVSAARNHGLRACFGEWILFVDADDRLEPHAVARLVETARATRADLVTAGYYKVFNDTVRVRDDCGVEAERIWDTRELCGYIKKYLKQPYKYTLLIHCWNVLYRRDIIANGLFFNERFTQLEDVDFNFRYLRHCAVVAYTADFLYNHTISSSQVALHRASHLTGQEDAAFDKFAEAYQSVRDYLHQVENIREMIDVRREVGHLYISWAIIALLRICRQLRWDSLFGLWRVVREIVNNRHVRENLPCYQAGKNESRAIHLAMRLNSPLLVLLSGYLRATTLDRRRSKAIFTAETMKNPGE